MSHISSPPRAGGSRDQTAGWAGKLRTAAALARTDIRDRYLNQSIGAAWAVVSPLITMAAYVLLFTTVFASRFDGDSRGVWSGVIYILSGLSAWLLTADVLSRSVLAIPSNKALLRQIRMPLDVIPLKEVMSALFPFCVSMLVVIGVVIARSPVSFPGMLYLLPAAILIHLTLLLGLAFLLSTLAAFNRDVKDIVGTFVSLGLFLAPILYRPNFVAQTPVLREIIMFNPFTYVIEMYHDALFYGRMTFPAAWGISLVFAAASLIVGYWIYSRSKSRFVEVA